MDGSPSSLLTLGLGAWGSPSLLISLGLGVGEEAETPLTASKLHVLTGTETRFHVLTGNPQTYELEV